MLRCPRCQSSEIYRTAADSKWASLRRKTTSKRPHSCHACGWHGWGEETGLKFTPEQIEMASRALTQPLDIEQDIGLLEVPKSAEPSDSQHDPLILSHTSKALRGDHEPA